MPWTFECEDAASAESIPIRVRPMHAQLCFPNMILFLLCTYTEGIPYSGRVENVTSPDVAFVVIPCGKTMF